MRLLDASTLQLTSFNERATPPYAILSHTWDDDEVSFQEMLAPTDAVRQKRGFLKILHFAALATRHGHHFLWVDTCCIDKASSAELSEAINSMYRYYERASVCYVFLADLTSIVMLRPPEERADLLRACRWFGRGWTLQELIAPRNVLFCDHEWRIVLKKMSGAELLAQVTRVPTDVLRRGDLSATSVAQRMSWMRSRTTTRPEDIAYCLLGLFGISMPLLYGEGAERAFVRLQEEIIRASDDESIFAWRATALRTSGTMYRGLLARHPWEFADAASIVEAPTPFTSPSLEETSVTDSNHIERTTPLPFASTNRGLSIVLPIRKLKPPATGFEAVLNCMHADLDGAYVTINLAQLAPAVDQFVRTLPGSLSRVSKQEGASFVSMSIYVRQTVKLPAGHRPLGIGGFHLAEVARHMAGHHDPDEIRPESVYPMTLWGKVYLMDVDTRTAVTRGAASFFVSPQPGRGTMALVLEWSQVEARHRCMVLCMSVSVSAEEAIKIYNRYVTGQELGGTKSVANRGDGVEACDVARVRDGLITQVVPYERREEVTGPLWFQFELSTKLGLLLDQVVIAVSLRIIFV